MASQGLSLHFFICNRMKRFFHILIVFLFWSSSSHAETRTVTVVNAIALSGDTIQIGQQKMKLWGIDAPELQQSCTNNFQEYQCGQMARYALQMAVAKGKLNCGIMGQDDMGQDIAKCSVGKLDLSDLMVQSGWALDAPDSNGYYARIQQTARQKGNGVWRGPFTKPWDWRAGDRFLSNP